MKKVLLFILVFSLLLTGCGKKQEKYMDQPAEDGKFYYNNKDLGFSITLPPEFLYYQTQRKETGGYKDVEFFVPTTIEFKHEVPGYAKPIVIRIFEKQAWEKINENDRTTNYSEVGEKDGRVYTIKFWELPPDDWKDKWTENMKKEILDSFKAIGQ